MGIIEERLGMQL